MSNNFTCAHLKCTKNRMAYEIYMKYKAILQSFNKYTIDLSNKN